jgi:hypothetical protein
MKTEEIEDIMCLEGKTSTIGSDECIITPYMQEKFHTQLNLQGYIR